MNEQQLQLLKQYATLLRDHRTAVDALLPAAAGTPFAGQLERYAAQLAAHLADVAGLLSAVPEGASPLHRLAPAAAGAPALRTNGINGATGLGLPPFDPHVLFEWQHAALPIDDPQSGPAFRQLYDSLAAQIAKLLGDEAQAAAEAIMGVIEGVDPLDPAAARWGIIFHPDTPPDVRAALQPLIRHRAAQCGYADPQQAIYTAKRDEDPYAFRLRHGQGHGDVDPQQLPYYLLLVGPPTQLSWRFQYGLDAQHAVGRLDFPSAAGYAAYVRSLIAQESPAAYREIFAADPPQRPPRQRQLRFFAPDHDEATALSAERLAGALHAYYATQPAGGGQSPVTAPPITGAAADKAALRALLIHAAAAPAIVFTASHGLYFPREDARQLRHQGALLCPGTRPWQAGDPVQNELFFGADDLQPADRCDGLLLFAFGCYTAGTPVANDFPNMAFLMPDELAAAPFTAPLAQRLLSQGALAVVGHVERAWHFSFAWQEEAQTAVYRSLLDAVLQGKPVGHAMEYFNARFLDVNHQLTTLDVLDYELNLRGMAYFELWAARNDARGFVVLGDPLVRLTGNGP